MTTTLSKPTLPGFDPLSPEFLRDPAPMVRKAQDEAPVFYYEPLDMWVITRYADICEAARDFKTFSSKAVGVVPPPEELAHRVPENLAQEVFIAIDPPEHTGSRTAVASFFFPHAVARYEDRMREIANELIDGFITKGSCDFMYDFAYPYSLQVIMEVLGIPTEHAADYRRWTNDFFSVLSPLKAAKPMAEDERRKRWEGLVECFDFFDALVADREANPRDDILSKMLAAKDKEGNPLVNRSRITRHINEFVAAGNDTTPNLMAQMLLFFEQFPDQRELLREQPELMPNAVEEILRRRGTSPGLFRITTRDVEIGGTTIPKGEIVWLLFAAGGLDERKFPEPEKIDICRENAKEHTSFGHGRHTCLGNPLGRLEIRVGMEEIFRRMPDIHVVKDQDLSYLPTLTVLILERLLVEWTPPAAS